MEIYQAALQIDPVDMSVIRRLAFRGIPDQPGLRAIYWKLLLQFLPRQKSLWDEETLKQRNIYQDWVQELILDPHQKYVSGAAPEGRSIFFFLLEMHSHPCHWPGEAPRGHKGRHVLGGGCHSR